MNVIRNIQAVATAVICSGGLALGALSPRIAQAAACTQAQCVSDYTFCRNVCSARGGFRSFVCPYGTNGLFACTCNSGGPLLYPCVP